MAYRTACGQSQGEAQEPSRVASCTYHAVMRGPPDIERTRLQALWSRMGPCRALSGEWIERPRTSFRPSID